MTAVLLNTMLTLVELSLTLREVELSVATGIANMAFVTVFMTAFSSMQRTPTHMSSPLGRSIGVLLLLPETILASLIGTAIPWLDLRFFAVVLVTAVGLLISLDKLIIRGKLLP